MNPRPTGKAAYPAVLEGRDVIGSAQTGTGKTAAFALPSLHRLRRKLAPDAYYSPLLVN